MTFKPTRMETATVVVVALQLASAALIATQGSTHPVPMHFNAAGEVDRWGDRIEAAAEPDLEHPRIDRRARERDQRRGGAVFEEREREFTARGLHDIANHRPAADFMDHLGPFRLHSLAVSRRQNDRHRSLHHRHPSSVEK